MEPYSQAVDKEFSRLISNGWKLWPKNIEGVRVSTTVNSLPISFPSDAWDASGENAEHTGYWAQHRAEQISNKLNKYGVSLMWEIGAGAGNATVPITQRGIPVIAIEPMYSGALNIATLGCETFSGTFDALKLPDQALECIGMFDVLEHIEKADVTISQVREKLSPKGIFIATVPAHRWLFSSFDIKSGHFRRYSRSSIRRELESAGLSVLEISWLFGFLVLPALVLRRLPYILGLRNHQLQSRAKTKMNSKVLDSLFRSTLRLESRFGIITGLSILVVAEKK